MLKLSDSEVCICS